MTVVATEIAEVDRAGGRRTSVALFLNWILLPHPQDACIVPNSLISFHVLKLRSRSVRMS